jgi:hypothetical protein
MKSSQRYVEASCNFRWLGYDFAHMVYQRSSTCREFEAGDAHCQAARARYG